MNTKIDDGGPAFPQPVERPCYGDTAYGMSLRDYLAGQYLAGWMACPDTAGTPDSCAEYAYKMADAFIRARALPAASEVK